MPTASFAEPFGVCARRALQLVHEAGDGAELVVVYDGPMPTPPAWLQDPRVHLLSTGSTCGPAVARNRAATEARGGILFFVDADVELAADSLERVRASFATDPDLVAVFGTYDDQPAASGIVSRFRNLLHHHTHVSHPGRAGTFWSGCGAVRAAMFHDLGGFDESYRRPSVEDIELGMRIEAAGGRIVLDPLLQCKHHKRWTLCSMVVTDIAYRAVPWTKLIVSTQRLPATLAIDWRNRLSGVVALSTLACLVASIWFGVLRIAACAGLAAVIALNFGFYRLCLRRGGAVFAAATIALHVLFFVYSSLAFGVVVMVSKLRWASGRIPRRLQDGDPTARVGTAVSGHASAPTPTP